MTDGQNNCGSITDAGAGLRNGNIPVRIDAVGFGLENGSQAQKDLLWATATSDRRGPLRHVSSPPGRCP